MQNGLFDNSFSAQLKDFLGDEIPVDEEIKHLNEVAAADTLQQLQHRYDLRADKHLVIHLAQQLIDFLPMLDHRVVQQLVVVDFLHVVRFVLLVELIQAEACPLELKDIVVLNRQPRVLLQHPDLELVRDQLDRNIL